MKSNIKFIAVVLFLMIVFESCVQKEEIDPIAATCNNEEIVANATFSEVKSLYQGEILQIQDDLVIEGYITSNDKAGNFFGTLHFQDLPQDPVEGFQINIDLRASHLFFGEGSKVFIKLRGLYLGNRNGVFEIGGVFTNAGGGLSVGRLPVTQVRSHLLVSCDPFQQIIPLSTSLEELNDTMLNTLIQLRDVEIDPRDICQPFAVPGERTERQLRDCNGNKIILNNSGFSDFQEEIMPSGSGEITGILGKTGNNYQLTIRDMSDINFKDERCNGFMFSCDETIATTSDRIFFSELADPNNNSGARFIELYNSGDVAVNLNGWEIRRYTNDNTTISSRIDLTGFIIQNETAFVIAADANEFENVYGFAPDLNSTANGPAGSNGDDNFELVDANGTIVDTFGNIGEDGSGTNHEFEDGRAVRLPDVIRGNPIYTFSEWRIYNDTGGAETINMPQNAPGSYTPGER